MFKIFCFKYRYQIQIIKSLYRKSYLQFRVYYGDMTIKKFRKYLQKVNTRRLDFESKLCFLLESRLDILLFRLNFVKTPREAREYIKCKKVKINDKIVNTLNYQIYINDIITFDKNLSITFYENLLNNLEKKKILFNYPRYLEINYNLMKCIFISYPKSYKDIPTT